MSDPIKPFRGMVKYFLNISSLSNIINTTNDPPFMNGLRHMNEIGSYMINFGALLISCFYKVHIIVMNNTLNGFKVSEPRN